MAKAGPRKRRCHSAKQLRERPVTLDSCSGPVVVASVKRGGVDVVEISYPADVPISQPSAKPQMPPMDPEGESKPACA